MIRLCAFHLCALLCTWALSLPAAQFSKATIAGKGATVCIVDARSERIQLFLHDDSGQPFKSFETVERHLAQRGQKLVFAMNAGMYHQDLSPVGLFFANARQVAPLNTNTGYGNFFMKPNGVFVITDKGPRVIETSEYPALKAQILLATQSGPLLVRAGKIHPQFSTNSTARVIRNAVGVSRAGSVVFAITDDPVSLYELATLFRDVLDCPDALYLDGVISSLHAPALKRSDNKVELGPLLGVVEAAR